MELNNEIYGAYAKVYIQYEGSIQDLGIKFQEEFTMTPLWYQNMEDEPYNLVGYAEIFGFEMQIQYLGENQKWLGYQFLLEATTTDSLEEIMNDYMFDISQWMARYIALICEVTTLAEYSNSDFGQSYFWNKSTFKRESRLVTLNK